MLQTYGASTEYAADENGRELSLPYGTAINRNVGAAKIDAEIGEYYSDHDEGEYVLQRRIVQH
jgi:hypothetical protein